MGKEWTASFPCRLVTLQEVDCLLPRSGFVRQARKLARLLRLKHVFGANKRWFWLMQYGNAILSRYPVSCHHNFRLPSKSEPRGLLLAGLTISCPAPPGQKIFFLCTHLSLDQSERRQQIKEINKIAAGLSQPAILAGDFNDALFHEELENIKELFNFPLSLPIFLLPTFPSGNPKFCLDHILASREWGFLKYSVISSEASDHLPVMGELQLLIP